MSRFVLKTHSFSVTLSLVINTYHQNNMKKALIFAITMLTATTISCGNSANNDKVAQCNDSVAKADTIVPVQRNILGIELGKTTVAEATVLCHQTGWNFELYKDRLETCININTEVNFGDIDWSSTSIIFYKYKACNILFFEKNCTHTKAQEAERFNAIAKLLLKKYPKAKVNSENTNLTYSDGTYEFNLQIDERGFGLLLSYYITNSQCDKIIGSEL